MGPKQVLPLQFRVDLGVMAMKRYSTFFKSPELEPHFQMQFSVIPDTHFLVGGVLILKRRINQIILSSPVKKLIRCVYLFIGDIMS